MPKHTHFWEIDGNNFGKCKCGAKHQFPKWKPNFNHKERTTIEQWELEYMPGYHLVEVQ